MGMLLMLDRIKERKIIAALAKEVESAEDEAIKANRPTLDALRDKENEARETWHRICAERQCATETIMKSQKANSARQKLRHALTEFGHDVVTSEYTSLPVLCEISGLPIFEGDEIYGSSEYVAVLKEAVQLVPL